jgi:hypothetical protein
MDTDFDRILDSLPEKRSRSRLQPYGALIRELLRRNRTYREIASVLLDRFQIHASISTIHDFVRRWSAPRGKTARTRVECAPPKIRKDQTNISANVQMPTLDPPVTSDEVQKRIAAVKSRPIPVAETRVFHYDPEQPLHISPPSSRRQKGE